MSADSVIDINTLLTPISDDNPVGRDLRYDQPIEGTTLYHMIIDMRRSAREQERQCLTHWDMFEMDDQWPLVLKNATEALAHHTKDLEICVYLIEALLRCHGMAGLRDGLELLRRLIENYWKEMYPYSDEDAYLFEHKDSILEELGGHWNGQSLLRDSIQLFPITSGKTSAQTYNYWQCQQAIEINEAPDYFWTSHPDYCHANIDLDKLRDQKTAMIAGCTYAQIHEAIRQTSPEFYQKLYADIEQCIVECINIRQALKNYEDSVDSGVYYSDSMDELIAYLREYVDSVKSITATNESDQKSLAEEDTTV